MQPSKIVVLSACRLHDAAIHTFFSALSTVSGRLMSKHKSTASESL